MPLSRTRSERAARRAAGILALVALASGCPFTPRDAPAPLCPLPADFKEPLRPDVTRDNIRAALRIQKVRCGSDSTLVPSGPSIDPNYQDSLDSGFVYVPDPEALSVAGSSGCATLFDGWNRESEVRFMRNRLEAAVDSLRPKSVEFTVTRFDTLEVIENGVRYTVDYQMTLEFQGHTERYGGRDARWDFVGANRNFWTLRRWQDNQPLADSIKTLGVFRASRCGQ